MEPVTLMVGMWFERTSEPELQRLHFEASEQPLSPAPLD